MKFCQDHWDRLRTAIEDRGLGDLIAPDGAVAAQQAVHQLDQGETPVNYDPLMAAHWAIVNNVTEAGGPGAFMHMMSGDVCPLCFANEEHAKGCDEENCTFTFDSWVDRAADDQAEQVAEMRGNSEAETNEPE